MMLITHCFCIFTVFQVVPHVTDAIRNWIETVSVIPVDGKEGPADVCVIELGGTVGMFCRRFFIYTWKLLILCIETTKEPF